MMKYKWKMRAFYKDTVKFPKVPGELAIEVCTIDDVAMDIEMKAFAARGDVYVDLARCDDGYYDNY